MSIEFPPEVPTYIRENIRIGVAKFAAAIGVSQSKLQSWVKAAEYKTVLTELNNFISNELAAGVHPLTINNDIAAIRCYLSLYSKNHQIKSVDDILYCEFRDGLKKIDAIDINILDKALDNVQGKIGIRNRAILKLFIHHSLTGATISRLKMSDYDHDKKELKASVRKQRRIYSIEGSTLEALENWLSIRGNQEFSGDSIFFAIDGKKIRKNQKESGGLSPNKVGKIVLDAAKSCGYNTDLNNIIRNSARQSRGNLKSELLTAIKLFDLMETSELVKKQIKRILKHVDNNID